MKKPSAKPEQPDLAKEIEEKETELRTLSENHDKMVQNFRQMTTEFNQQVALNQATYQRLEGYIAALKSRQK